MSNEGTVHEASARLRCEEYRSPQRPRFSHAKLGPRCPVTQVDSLHCIQILLHQALQSNTYRSNPNAPIGSIGVSKSESHSHNQCDQMVRIKLDAFTYCHKEATSIISTESLSRLNVRALLVSRRSLRRRSHPMPLQQDTRPASYNICSCHHY